MRAVLVVLLLVSFAAHADDRKQYLAQLRVARKLATGKRWAEAKQAYEALLKSTPGDLVALSEEGLVSLHAGDLPGARALIEKAATCGGTSAEQASALAILKLDRDALARIVEQPRRMEGPFVGESGALLREHQLALFKAAFPDLVDDLTDAEVRERLHASRAPLAVSLTGTGISGAEVWYLGADFNRDKETYILAVQTARGWYTQELGSFWENRWNEGGDGMKLLAPERASVSGRQAIVLLWETDEELWAWSADPIPDDTHENAEGRGERETHLALVAVGSTGEPSGTPGILVAMEVRPGTADGKHDRRPRARAALDVSFPPEGGMVLSGPTVAPTKVPKRKWQDILEPLKPRTIPLTF